MLEAMSAHSSQSTMSASSRLPIGAADIGPWIGKPNLLPG
jgi:hypothetical protein